MLKRSILLFKFQVCKSEIETELMATCTPHMKNNHKYLNNLKSLDDGKWIFDAQRCQGILPGHSAGTLHFYSSSAVCKTEKS